MSAGRARTSQKAQNSDSRPAGEADGVGGELFDPSDSEKILKSSKPIQQKKYRNTLTEADGIKFSSKREATRWQRLLLTEKAGLIRNLRRQVAYELRADGGNVVGKYVADHVYEELTDGFWELVVEDVKGFPTPLYDWKKRHMAAEHGVTIREV